MAVIAYIRVSTEEQHLGPEAQLATIEAWAAREGLGVDAVHRDIGVSGGAPLERCAGLVAALDSLRDGDVLVVAKRDRLGRDMIRCAMAERMAERVGARIVTADGVGDGDGPEHLLMRRMVDAFAEYERGLISARTRAGLGVLRRQGVRLGGDSLALRRTQQRGEDGRLAWEHDHEGQETMRIVRELRDQGLTLRAIATELTRLGRPTLRGGAWHPEHVRRCLDRVAA